MIYVLTAPTNDKAKDMEKLKVLCDRFSFSGTAVSPMLSFTYLKTDESWYSETYYRDLLDACDQMYVVADEVTARMIRLIKRAIERNIRIEFYDDSGNRIDYDALIINKRIGPGYRKMIMLAHGDVATTGVCPHCGALLGAEEK